MASGGGSVNTLDSNYDESINYSKPLILMIILFFLFGAVTVLNDILIPHLKEIFELKSWEAMLVQSCFFGAYFIMGAPSGLLIAKLGYKKGIIVGLLILAIGLLMFYPASSIAKFGFYLFSLFFVGCGLAVLQTAVNPYTAACGKPEKTGMRMNLAGFTNSAATFIFPIVGGALIFVEGTNQEKLEAVELPYLALAGAVFIAMVAVSMMKVPQVVKTESSDADSSDESALKYKHLVLGALAIFFYVGAEVACGSIIIDYLALDDMGAIPKTDAKYYVSLYWGGLMVGRLAGIVILQKVKMQKAVTIAASLAIVLTLITMMTSGDVSKWALVAIGLCCSIMWPCIFPLGIAGLGGATGKGAGIMVSMIVGGALIPPIHGYLAESIGYHMSFVIVIISFAYILYYGLKGHKVSHPDAIKRIEEEA